MQREKQPGSTLVKLITLGTIHPQIFPSSKYWEHMFTSESLNAREDYMFPHSWPFLQNVLSLVKTVKGFQLLFLSLVLLEHKWLCVILVHQESICFYFYNLQFCYPSTSNYSLTEQILATLEFTEMTLIIIVCGYASLQILLAHADF